ncbi:hypothetical protein [Lysobacter gummosus]
MKRLNTESHSTDFSLFARKALDSRVRGNDEQKRTPPKLRFRADND